MPTNSNPSHTECPSCSGCSLHANHGQADIPVAASIPVADIQVADLGESGLPTNGSSCLLADPASDGPLRGARFALASLGLFLAPVLLATTGAILSMSDWAVGDWGVSEPNGQFLGATCGLLVGMVGSMVVARVLRARSHQSKPLEIKSLEISKGETP